MGPEITEADKNEHEEKRKKLKAKMEVLDLFSILVCVAEFGRCFGTCLCVSRQ